MSSTITGTQQSAGVFLDMAAIRRALEPGIRAGIAEVMRTERESVEEAISIPVVRDFAGNVIERSAPGDPPRMDEDILHGIGIEDHVVSEEGESVGYLTATRPPQEPDDDPHAALILEYGGQSNWGYVQPRPFMGPGADRMAGYAAEVIGRHLIDSLKK